MKIRKSDLEGIVDEVSDDEGDEYEGIQRRMEEDRKRDRQLQMKILKNLADGHVNRSNKGEQNRGHFGIDQLTKGDITAKDSNMNIADIDNEDDVYGSGNEFDDDELLQAKLLNSFTERAKSRRDNNIRNEDSDISLSDSEEEVSDNENENGMLCNGLLKITNEKCDYYCYL